MRVSLKRTRSLQYLLTHKQIKAEWILDQKISVFTAYKMTATTAYLNEAFLSQCNYPGSGLRTKGILRKWIWVFNLHERK